MLTLLIKRILFTGILFFLFLFPHTALSDNLCVQLKWTHQSQFSGFYLAIEEGLYKAEGINVSLREGGPQIDWQEQMQNRECPIGITNPYEIVIAKSRGVPVKAIATIAQTSPIVWFSLEDSGIKDPRQFRGKKIALVPTGKIHFMGMLAKVQVPLEETVIMPFSLDMSPLYNGEVDVWSGYHTNLVTKAEQEGHRLNIIHPLNYGIQIYDDVIYARDDLINGAPELIERFLRATLEGWMKTVRDPERAVTHTLKYTKSNDKAFEMMFLLRTIPYVHTGEIPIGWMEQSIWKEICELTKEVGLIEAPVNEADVFTDRFLRNIYGERNP